tara:strand:+ start:19 stop:768 length:750 start_codon:yes stop_codon:yes gene_type:complete
MKLSKKFKSPNYNVRKSKKIKFIIIHYTALKNYKKAISHLCNVKNKVSSHYLISQSGKIYNLVDDKMRAWHAGQAYWKKSIDMNSQSIGIELDYSKNIHNNKFSENMIESLLLLLNKLKKKYKIKDHNILGHSDIAPFRKIDPGPDFPWKRIYNYDFSLNSFEGKRIKITDLKFWFKKNNINSSREIALFILSFIGYDTSKVIKNKKLIKVIISAYQAHYLQYNYTGVVDRPTLGHLYKHLFNNLLTKV